MSFTRFHAVQVINRYFGPLWQPKKVDKRLLEYYLNQLDQPWIQAHCQPNLAILSY